MKRLRFFLVMTALSVGLFVATNPVFAATTKTPTKGGAATSPGNPVLPEAPIAVLLPLIGIVVIGLAFFFIQRRNRSAASE